MKVRSWSRRWREIREVGGDPEVGWRGDRRLGRTLWVAKGVFGYKFVAANHRYM